jgi:hypothetical protein
MPRILRTLGAALVVEWHPLLQRLAGFEPDVLPRWLLARGFSLSAVSHTGTQVLAAEQVDRLTTRLLRLERPVELLALPSRASRAPGKAAGAGHRPH